MMRDLRVFFVSLFLFLLINCDSSTDGNSSRFPLADEHNIDGSQLETAFDNAASIDDMEGMAVARNHVIVAEAYYHGANSAPDIDLDVRSVTKSYMSTLYGIALDKGHIDSLEQTVGYFLEDRVTNDNPALGEVTLRQLLTMSAGHEWSEIDGPSEYPAMASAPNQLEYIVAKPIVNTPGTVFDYSDGAAHLSSIVFTYATGMTAEEYANDYLFGPMGLGDRRWYPDRQGHSYGGTTLCVGIHDMIAMGYLYLDKGMYDGKRIVSGAWIDEATSYQISAVNWLPYLTSYGYYWWRGSQHGHDYILAVGYGGQFILVAEDLNLVVAARCDFRGNTANESGINWSAIQNIIINQVLPAVRD